MYELDTLSPSWGEIATGVLGLVLVAALVVAVVLFLLPGARDVADDVVVEGRSAADIDQPLFAQLRQLRRFTVVDALPGHFTVSRSFAPGWAYVCAILAFPIGLLALLARSKHTIQVSLVDLPEGCRIRVVGSALRVDIEDVAAAIQAALPDRSLLA